jgi:Fur family peroxide stress response transcriptional regulator
LALLAEMGKIVKIKAEDAPLRFDANTEPHYHLRCRCCGKVCDLALPPHRELEEEAERLCGGLIDGHELYFFGRCKKCAEDASIQF